MARQYPARILGSMRIKDVERGAVTVVSVDARALKLAMREFPGQTMKEIVSLALVDAVTAAARRKRSK